MAEEVSSQKSLSEYTWEEVAQHKSVESLWLVVNNEVYDVTDFIEEVSLITVYRSWLSFVEVVWLSLPVAKCHPVASRGSNEYLVSSRIFTERHYY